MIDRPTNLEPAVGRLLVEPDNMRSDGWVVWRIEKVEHKGEDIRLTMSDPMNPEARLRQTRYKPESKAWIAPNMTMLEAYARLVGGNLR